MTASNQPEPSFQDDFGKWLEANGVELDDQLDSGEFRANINLNQLKAAIMRYSADDKAQAVAEAERVAAYEANRAVVKEQKKYLQDMTLADGVTVIKALSVGMMYACANNLAAPLEREIKVARLTKGTEKSK